MTTINTYERLQEGQKQWPQKLREEVIISAAQRWAFVEKMVFHLSFEEWAECGY